MEFTGKEFTEQLHPLSASKDLDPLIERVGNARIVLLGEASHGTHEYYTWRAAITKRLVREKGFNVIAVEGDWPDCYRINRYIKGYEDTHKSPQEVLRTFNRWPTWMWANWEMVALTSWLKIFNEIATPGKKVGFYGLDVYSLWESMEALLKYLRTTDPPVAKMAEEALRCFSAYGKNEKRYAMNAMSNSCKKEVVRLLKAIRSKAMYYNHDPEAMLNTTQNAFVISEAENYYRSMVEFDDETWNIRDTHMMATLKRLIDFHGPKSKVIVWEHNTHIGDARYTDMRNIGMVNTGQLARAEFGEEACVLVGFGSYSGSVIAGGAWGSQMEDMEVPPARPGSIEEQLHNESPKNRLLLFNDEFTAARYSKIIPHRAIGVVYDPKHEHHNYVPSFMARRYDAFIYLDRTTAVHPLHVAPDLGQVPETYPFEF